MQLMPATAMEVGVSEPYDPLQSLRGGLTYLRWQYDRFPEIPAYLDRLYWSLAAYNCGRGYCNEALRLARRAGIRNWWAWESGKEWLVGAEVNGKVPRYEETWNYVIRIRALAL